MKLLLLSLVLLVSMPSFAKTVRYINSDGCVVEKEQRKGGVILHIIKGDLREEVGYGNNYSFGDFSYCAENHTDINFYEGARGVGIMISCSEHENGYKVTRGRADISIIGGELKEVKIDGQVKGLLGWSQDVEIECLDLVKE